MELTQIEQLGVSIIEENNPAGTDARSGEDFDLLKGEISKLTSLTGAKINWQKVVEHSVTILSKQSKDLLVASYLCAGLFNTNGFSGLKAGLVCFHGILTNFWDSLFPPLRKKKTKARSAALAWLAEEIVKQVNLYKPVPEDREALVLCDEAIEPLQKLIYERFEEDVVSFSGLKDAIARYLSELPEPVKVTPPGKEVTKEPDKKQEAEPAQVKKEPEKTVKPPPQQRLSKPPDIAVADTAKSIQNEQDVTRLMNELNTAYLRLSSFLFEQNKANPLPYRIARFVAWLELTELPANENLKTRVPSVDSSTIDRVKMLINNKYWEALVEFAESNLTEFPLWLDLNYYAVLALSNMGVSYKQAQEAIASELEKLLSRLPELVNLHFSDGTAFASQDTKNWLDSVLVSKAGGAGAAKSEMPEELMELKTSARSLVIEKKHKEALAVLEQGLDKSATNRERFIFTMEIAKAYLDAQRFHGAVALLEPLDNDIQRFSLETWDQPLAYETLHLLWRSLTAIAQSNDEPQPELASRIKSVYDRLCRLSPMAAFDIV